MTSTAAVVFDLDDTLYPERAYAFSGFEAVAAEFEDRLGSRSETAAEMRRLFETEHRPRVFDALLARLGLLHDRELRDAMIRAYREHAPTISLHPDADRAIVRLSTLYRLGLITDSWAHAQQAKITSLGVADRFDAVIVTAELGGDFAKPHPRAFELTAERLAVTAGRCAYVADNPAKDFIAPNALGWKTIQIRRADGIYRDVAPAPDGIPGTVIHTLDDLDGLLV